MKLDTNLPGPTLARESIDTPYITTTNNPTKLTPKTGDWLCTEPDAQIKRRGSVQAGNDFALRPLSRNRPASQDGTEAVEGAGREQGAPTIDEEPSVEYLDGGFGWAIVASTFVITFHFLGFLYSWGVIQADLLGKGLASSQLLSVVGGLQAFWNAAGCIPAAWIIQRIGVRKTTVFGVVLNSLAVLLASFSTESLGGLIFLQGIVAGIACGALFMVSADWALAFLRISWSEFTVLAGMGSGGYFSLQSSIVAQIVGSHRVNQAIGAIELASSIGFLAGPISGGALLDAFGGPSAGAEAYKPAMYLVGGTTFVSVVLAVWIRASYSRKIFIKA
ncbi:hypothetical protein QFC21_000023 [Naganishia friedmannii]|uniref:Uncharacterized protein n=1 Tax=Naganishia friedmannii TaxID=89922 RepID=A0ACC2WB81_9TREE|nr:hypothetical protein QFC21_000023 [Naganishia friedmannii]